MEPALLVSIVALLVSGASFGWNIYREIGLRARLKVQFAVREIHHPTITNPLVKVFVTATNFGPGAAKVQMIVFKGSLWRSLTRRRVTGMIVHDYTDPLCEKLPCKLEVGDSLNLVLKYSQDFSLSPEITRIGLTDNFGRTHWAPSSDVRAFRLQHNKDFPSKD